MKRATLVGLALLAVPFLLAGSYWWDYRPKRQRSAINAMRQAGL